MTLAKSLRQHKKGSLLTICLSILEVVFEIIIPLCMSGLIDYGCDKHSERLSNADSYGNPWSCHDAFCHDCIFPH